MGKIDELARRGTQAIKELRITELRRGNTFMINTNHLPGDQCYLEYPEGKIVLSTFISGSRNFIPLRELSHKEATAIRRKYNFDLIRY